MFVFQVHHAGDITGTLHNRYNLIFSYWFYLFSTNPVSRCYQLDFKQCEKLVFNWWELPCIRPMTIYFLLFQVGTSTNMKKSLPHKWLELMPRPKTWITRTCEFRGQHKLSMTRSIALFTQLRQLFASPKAAITSCATLLGLLIVNSHININLGVHNLRSGMALVLAALF